MAPLLLLMILFFFLLVGAVTFVACAAGPPSRRFALSAALWCAMWGPCVIGFLMLAGLALVANGLVAEYPNHYAKLLGLPLPNLPAGIWHGYFLIALIGTAAVATAVAWLHQVVVRRMTFALFRLYAMCVSAGIGSVFGWAGSVALSVNEVHHPLALGCLLLVCLITGFGYLGFRWARELRGGAPKKFSWVSKEEFEGV